MHYLYLVFSKGGDFQEAQEKAERFLDGNGFTVNEGFYYARGKADWWHVGGRWSGLFTELTDEYKEFKEKAEKMMKEKYPDIEQIRGIWYSDEKKKQQKKEAKEDIKKMWQGTSFTVSCPLLRDSLGREGISTDNDDTQKISKKVFERLQQIYSEAECMIISEGVEKLLENISYEDIENEYATIIDYHN